MKCRVAGYTLIEALMTLSIGSILTAGLVQEYGVAVSLSHDQKVREQASLVAQSILQAMGSEIRILGNGVPFEQANFQIGEDTLSDPTVTQPLSVQSSTATSITFRLNEMGRVHMLSQDFDPSATSILSLVTVEGLNAGDSFYISNSTVAGDDGFYGIVDSLDEVNDQITVSSGSVFSPGATFDTGSTLEATPLVTFTSPVDGSGITRDSGSGAIPLGPGSTFSLRYLDYLGNELTLPMSESDLVLSLRSIEISISVSGVTSLASGEVYTAEVSQTYSLRNLIYVF